MPISFTLPLEGKPASVKDKVFTILTMKYPLSLIELLNEIKRQYNVSVTFQGVRKAVLELCTANVLIKDGKKFSISTEWIINLTKYASMLHRQYFPPSGKKIKVEVGPNVTVYTFNRLLDLDFVWNSIIREHFSSKPEPPKYVTFEAAHFWFVIVTLAQETELMKDMLAKNIKLFYASYGATPIDHWAAKHYNSIGVHCKTMQKPDNFADGYNIGVYGNLVIYTQYPPSIAKKMNDFFRKHKRIEDVNLDEVYQIVNLQEEIQLTVIHDPVLAQSRRDMVLRKFNGTKRLKQLNI